MKPFILAVEDDKDILACYKDLLESHGYGCYEASSGNLALKLLEKEYLNISMIISDISMDDGDGVFLLKKVKELYPKIPLMFISGKDDVIIKEMHRLGARSVMQKPFSPDDLIRSVKICVGLPN